MDWPRTKARTRLVTAEMNRPPGTRHPTFRRRPPAHPCVQHLNTGATKYRADREGDVMGLLTKPHEKSIFMQSSRHAGTRMPCAAMQGHGRFTQRTRHPRGAVHRVRSPARWPCCATAVVASIHTAPAAPRQSARSRLREAPRASYPRKEKGHAMHGLFDQPMLPDVDQNGMSSSAKSSIGGADCWGGA